MWLCSICAIIWIAKVSQFQNICAIRLAHWGRGTHICVSELTIIGSDNGLSPGWRQAIIWTNAGILLSGPLGTNFSEILIEIYKFSFKKMHFKLSSAKWQPICLGLNVLRRNTVSGTTEEMLVITWLWECHQLIETWGHFYYSNESWT